MLQDVVSILGDGLHGTPEYDDNGEYYFINGNNLFNGKIVIKENTKRANKEEFEKYKKNLNDRTILVSINGTIGNIAVYNNEKCFPGKSACYFNVLEGVEKKFIRYVVTNGHFQTYISEFAHGTTIKNVSLKTIREYPFLLPDPPEQKAIAAVLSSLDDKIDLLHRQNTTLEALAETLFRQWFVVDAKEDWKVGTLGDLVDFNYGKALRDQERRGNKYPVYGSSGIVGFHDEYNVEAPGIITGRKGTLGLVNYSFYNFFPIDTTFYITSKIGSNGLYFDYFLLKSLTLGEMNSDSAVPGLNRNLAHGIQVAIPPVQLINDFNHTVNPIFEKLKHVQTQIRTLEKLRDSLLPKLMSGEVRVKL